MVQGLTPERAREQWAEIDEVRQRVDGIEIFKSVEIDILKDGSLDMPDDVLEELDVVVISVHSRSASAPDLRTVRSAMWFGRRTPSPSAGKSQTSTLAGEVLPEVFVAVTTAQ